MGLGCAIYHVRAVVRDHTRLKLTTGVKGCHVPPPFGLSHVEDVSYFASLWNAGLKDQDVCVPGNHPG
jgi:hypothetical protein